MYAEEELDLDQLHEVEAVVVDEVLSGSSWVCQLIHNPSCQLLKNPNDSLLQYQSIKNKDSQPKKKKKDLGFLIESLGFCK